MTRHYRSLFINSDTSNRNVVYRSSEYSEIRVKMSPPFSLPRGAKNPIVRCTRAVVWNTFVNIFDSGTNQNNIIYYTDDLADPDKYNITLDKGLYDITTMNASIDNAVVANGHATGLITLEPDYSTSKVIFNISAAGWQLYFKTGVSPYTMLGTTAENLIPNALTTGAYFEKAANIADFAVFSSLAIHCPQITSQSNFVGATSDVVAQFQLTSTSIGSVYTYDPNVPEKIPADLLSGGSQFAQMTFRLTDQAGVLVDTNNEDWSFNLQIEFDMDE